MARGGQAAAGRGGLTRAGRAERGSVPSLMLVVGALGVVLPPAILALVAWRRRDVPGAAALAAMLLAAASWAATYIGELASADLATKLLWAKVEGLGAA